MRDYTNLAWPEGPFGADQRPFGKPAEMVAAFAIDWGGQPDPLPLAAATAYLRVRKHGQPLHVGGDTLSIGFRATVAEDRSDAPELLALLDRALSRARRHALILAGHDLAGDLARMVDLSPAPLRGAVGVASAWQTRHTRQRGMALMIDTATDAHDTALVMNLLVDPTLPADECTCAARARAVLARCLAIGLTAAVHAGRYRTEGTFPVAETVERTGWDLFADPGRQATPPHPTGPPAMAVVTSANDTTGHEPGE